MTKAKSDLSTGDRAVAPETPAAEQGCLRPQPGLTSSVIGQDTSEADAGLRARLDSATFDVAPQTAAAAVSATAPSILDLGKHLAQVEIAYNAHDIVELKRGVRAGDEDAMREATNRSEAAQIILGERQEALRDLICTLPAKTLADAAIHVAGIVTLSARLSASICTADQVTRAADKIERMALGMLPILAAAAGLDMEAMDWADNDQLRPLRFTGVEVQS